MEHYSSIKKNELRPSAATWMGLEIAILSESMSDRAGEVSYNIPYMWNLKRKENK